MTVWGMIDAQTIVFPVVVSRVNIAMLYFLVPAEVARREVPPAFEVEEVKPGWAQVVIMAADLRENPWGAYDEVSLSIVCRPAADPDSSPAGFLLGTVVNQRFGAEAGHRALRVPRTLAEIDTRYTTDHVRFAVSFDGSRALTLHVPRARSKLRPERLVTKAYAYVDDNPYATTLEIEMPPGVVEPGDVVVDLGCGALAEQLRRLGLSHHPSEATWGEDLAITYDLPYRL